MADMIEGVLLAGGLNKGRLSECTAEKWEAMIDINGHPMAAYVVKAFLESGRVSRVVVSGPGELETALAEFGDRVRLVRPGENLLDSLMNALDGTSGRKVLIGSADIPLINGEAIKDVIERCDADEAEVHYALVMKDDYERSYPGGKRTYINLKDGVRGQHIHGIQGGPAIEERDNQTDVRQEEEPAGHGDRLGDRACHDIEVPPGARFCR